MPQPQLGETRSGATETVRWDGTRWQPIARDVSAEKGYHPGLEDSEHPNLAMLKGFFSGASEAATPGKVGTLAALAIPGVLPAAIGAAGATAGLDMLRSHFDTANAPKNVNEFVDNMAISGLPAVAGGIVGKAGSVADKGLELGSQIPGKVGTISKIARQATSIIPKILNTRLGTLPWEDAADAPIEALHGADAFRDAGRRLPRSTEVPGSSYPEPAPAEDPLPQSSVMHGSDQYRHGGEPRTVETYSQQFGPNPEFHSVETGEVPPRLVKGGSGEPATVESALDTVLKGLSDEGTSTSRLADTPSVRSMDRGNMANGFPRLSPEEMGRAQGGAFRSGANIPSGASPTEHLFQDDIDGPHFDPYEDADYVAPGDVHVMDEAPLHAGQDVPAPNDVEDLVKHLLPEPAQPSAYDAAQGRIKQFSDRLTAMSGAMANPGAGMPDSLKAIDTLFGPGAKDLGGEALQATSGKGANNLLYDPQTPSDYLRQQMQGANSPEEQEFFGRALRQRLRLGQSQAFQGLLPR